MSFYQKYELERLIADGETKTFRATENASGRLVFLHLFNPEAQPLLVMLKAKLAKDPLRPVLPLLELGEFAGNPYAVTEPVTPFKNLREWLAKISDAPAASPTPPTPAASKRAPDQFDEFARLFEDHGPAPAAKPAETKPVESKPVETRPMTARSAAFAKLFEDEQPGPATAPKQPAANPGSDEFARLFEAPRPPATAESKSTASAPDEFARLFENPKPPSAPAAKEPGEFTRFFGAGSPRAKPDVQQSAPPASPPAQGEFTKFFGGSSQKPAPPKSAPKEPDDFSKIFGGPATPPARTSGPPAAAETGQFTRLFGSGPSGEAINIEEEQARAAKNAAPESRPFQAPSPFTRVFGPGENAPGRSAPPPRPLTIGNASGLFRSVKSPDPQPVESAPVEKGPGEYTKMIARGGPAGPQQASPQPPSPPPAAMPIITPAPKRGLMIGLSVVTGVLVLVILVVIVMATKRN